MSNENKFWILSSAIFSTAVVLITLISTMYWDNHNAKIVDLVKSGIDPVAAMCAMQDDYGKHPTCIVLAVKKD